MMVSPSCANSRNLLRPAHRTQPTSLSGSDKRRLTSFSAFSIHFSSSLYRSGSRWWVLSTHVRLPSGLLRLRRAREAAWRFVTSILRTLSMNSLLISWDCSLAMWMNATACDRTDERDDSSAASRRTVAEESERLHEPIKKLHRRPGGHQDHPETPGAVARQIKTHSQGPCPTCRIPQGSFLSTPQERRSPLS